MQTITFTQAKGGQGTSVFAAAVAITAAQQGRKVVITGHDTRDLAAILGFPYRADVAQEIIPGLFFGWGCAGEMSMVFPNPDLVIDDAGPDAMDAYLVTRGCYLALRSAVQGEVTYLGAVHLDEPGRALGRRDVADVLSTTVVVSVPVDAAVARAVDAGLLATRLPKSLANAASEFLAQVAAVRA